MGMIFVILITLARYPLVALFVYWLIKKLPF